MIHWKLIANSLVISYSTDLMQRHTRGWGIRRYQIESDDSRVNALSLVSAGWVILVYSLFAARVQSD